jgi:hypothetical protein
MLKTNLSELVERVRSWTDAGATEFILEGEDLEILLNSETPVDKPKNAERSERAYRAILAAYGQDQSVEENTIDMLTDIMHMAPDYGDFDEMLATARMHYEVERVK